MTFNLARRATDVCGQRPSDARNSSEEVSTVETGQHMYLEVAAVGVRNALNQIQLCNGQLLYCYSSECCVAEVHVYCCFTPLSCSAGTGSCTRPPSIQQRCSHRVQGSSCMPWLAGSGAERSSRHDQGQVEARQDTGINHWHVPVAGQA
jgi:hypothetical protein